MTNYDDDSQQHNLMDNNNPTMTMTANAMEKQGGQG